MRLDPQEYVPTWVPSGHIHVTHKVIGKVKGRSVQTLERFGNLVATIHFSPFTRCFCRGLGAFIQGFLHIENAKNHAMLTLHFLCPQSTVHSSLQSHFTDSLPSREWWPLSLGIWKLTLVTRERVV